MDCFSRTLDCEATRDAKNSNESFAKQEDQQTGAARLPAGYLDDEQFAHADVKDFYIGEEWSDAGVQTEPPGTMEEQHLAGLLQRIQTLEPTITRYHSDTDEESDKEDDEYGIYDDCRLTAAEMEEVAYFNSLSQAELHWLLSQEDDYEYDYEQQSNGSIACDGQAQSPIDIQCADKSCANGEISNYDISTAWLDQLDWDTQVSLAEFAWVDIARDIQHQWLFRTHVLGRVLAVG